MIHYKDWIWFLPEAETVVLVFLLLTMVLCGMILLFLVIAMLCSDWKRGRDEARYRKEDA